MFGRLLLLFIAIPVIELWLFLSVGTRIGLGTTLCIIVLTGILGATITKQQGSQALQSIRNALQNGQIPHQEAIDGLLILLAGAILLTPGFLTDAVGFSLLVPQLRAIVRNKATKYFGSKTVRQAQRDTNPENTPFAENPSIRSAKGRVVSTTDH